MGQAHRWVESLEPRRLLAGTPTPGLVLGGTGTLTVNDIETLSDGSYVLAGFFTGQVDFQPKGGTSFVGIADDGVIARYSANNKLIWVNTFAGDGNQAIDAI